MLWESYREMARLDESKKLGERFISLLDESEKAAIDLEKALATAGADRAAIRDAIEKTQGYVGINGTFNMSAEDHNGLPVFLARSDWHVTCATEDWPQVRFLATREH